MWYCTYLSRALIKLDFPAPVSPVTTMFTSTSRHLSNMGFKNLSIFFASVLTYVISYLLVFYCQHWWNFHVDLGSICDHGFREEEGIRLSKYYVRLRAVPRTKSIGFTCIPQCTDLIFLSVTVAAVTYHPS